MARATHCRCVRCGFDSRHVRHFFILISAYFKGSECLATNQVMGVRVPPWRPFFCWGSDNGRTSGCGPENSGSTPDPGSIIKDQTMFYKYTEDRKHLRHYLKWMPYWLITVYILVLFPFIPILCMLTNYSLKEGYTDVLKSIRTKYVER